MESASKVNLSNKDLEKIIKKSFGYNSRILNILENNEGWFNSLFSISISNGLDVYIKIAPEDDVDVLRYEKNIIFTEVDILKRFEAFPDIPSPKILVSDYSKSIIPANYFIMEKLEGISLASKRKKIDKETLKKIDYSKGKINKRINSIIGKKFGIYGDFNHKYDSWKEAFLELVSFILTDAQNLEVDFSVSISDIYDLFDKFSFTLDDITTPSLIHWDLHDGNIIIDNNKEISGVIDCDRALWGDPAIEFYFSKMFQASEEFFVGYNSNIQNEKTFDIRRALYDLYLTIIFVSECKSRKIKDKNHINWAYEMFNTQLNEVKNL